MFEKKNWARLGLAGALIQLAACSGGGSESEPAPSARVSLEARSETDLAAGALQTREWLLRNTGNKAASSLQVQTVAQAQLRQLPLSCVGAGAEQCVLTADGGIVLAELAPGAQLRIQQPVRVDAGYQGSLSNRLGLREGNEASFASETLNVWSADLSVSVEPAGISELGGRKQLSYRISLRNAGPGTARQVQWRQLASPLMQWLDGSCQASGGAQCPTAIGEDLKGLQLPAGARLDLQVRYEYRGNTERPGGYLSSEVLALGDSKPANNQGRQAWGTSYDGDAPYRAMLLHGESAELQFSWTDALWRWTQLGRVLDLIMSVDVEGVRKLAVSGETQWSPRWGSTLDIGSIALGAHEVNGQRRAYLATRAGLGDLQALEGLSFNVLMAQSDRNGRPTASRMWTARVQQGVFELCAADTVIAVTNCPETARRRYWPSWVKGRLELMSDRDVVRLESGLVEAGGQSPLLFGSQDLDAQGRRWTWIWVPQRGAYNGFMSLVESNFGSAEGLFLTKWLDYNYSHGSPNPGEGYTEVTSYLSSTLFKYQALGGIYCAPSGRLVETSIPGLSRGSLAASSSQGACWSGEIWRAEARGISVMLGMQGGPLQGQWAIQIER